MEGGNRGKFRGLLLEFDSFFPLTDHCNSNAPFFQNFSCLNFTLFRRGRKDTVFFARNVSFVVSVLTN